MHPSPVSTNPVPTLPHLLEVHAHINEICNLRCAFCLWNSPLLPARKKNDRTHLSLPALKRLIDDCVRLQARSLNLEGGEISLHPQALALLDYALASNLHLSVYCNGLINAAMLKRLVRIARINVNLSASTPETYRQIHAPRQQQAFTRVIRNLRLLGKASRTKGYPRITMTFIVNKLNFHEIKNIFSLAKDLGAHELHFKPLELFWDYAERSPAELEKSSTRHLLLSESDKDQLSEDLSSLADQKEPLLHNAREFLALLKNREFQQDMYSGDPLKKHINKFFYFAATPFEQPACHVSRHFAFIDTDGTVRAPCERTRLERIGNINTASFAKLWLSRKYQDLRARTMNDFDINNPDFKACRFCRYVEFNRNQNLNPA